MNEQTPKPTNGVRVNIGGTEFTLRYTLAAMKAAKSHFGGSIADGKTLSSIDVEDLGKLLWFGTLANHPDVTVDQLDALIDPTQREELLKAYMAAMGRALPDPNATGSPQDMIRQLNELLTRAEAIQTKLSEAMTSTGSSSGPSDVTTSGSPTPISGA